MWSLPALLTRRARDACRRFSSPPSRSRSAARSARRPGVAAAGRARGLRQQPECGRSASAACSAITRSTSWRCGSRRPPRRSSSTTSGRCSSCCSRPCCRTSGCALIMSRASLLGLAGTVVLFVGRGGWRSPPSIAGLCGGLRRRLRLGDLFGAVAPLCRRADRCGRGLLPGDRGAVGHLPPAVRDDGVAGRAAANGSRCWRSASGRWARRSMPGTSA